jgi:hypothetical protein
MKKRAKLYKSEVSVSFENLNDFLLRVSYLKLGSSRNARDCIVVP